LKHQRSWRIKLLVISLRYTAAVPFPSLSRNHGGILFRHLILPCRTGRIISQTSIMAAPTMAPRTEEDEYEEDPRFDDADVSTAPFVEHPAYGRGLWRNPIQFVSAAPDAPIVTATPANGRTMAEKYLAIMFPNGQPQPKPEAYPACGICGEPVKEQDQRMHYLSPAHQAALPRAPIPSSIDRTRMGLKYMSKHGYDVDARVGLGASGQGMLFPLVPKEKRDKLGLGIDKKEHEKKWALGGASAADVKEGKLDAGKIRKLAKVEKRKHDKLQKMFYGNDEVEKYLGHLDG
jgi:hypothetical protein